MANSRGFLGKTRVTEGPPEEANVREVAQVAYELYEQRGRADGHDMDDWLAAEAIVRQRAKSRRSRFTV